ncbi:DUF3316 domain-containing protein [Vibrio sonorensis]|uniref:DUF3316 domain-containing protein n=1 Tax=Vibrio sonorensis TaxID=1004316 RepID=UPI0008D98F1D|nr:DUF3316 domain-containing protein [Vibrio sonorensis]
MIKVISLASVFLFSSVAMAGLSGSSSTVVTNGSLNGDLEMSKDAAFAAGKDMLMDINNKTPFELSKSVNYKSNSVVDRSSFEIRDSNVTIREVITSDGDIAYQPVVNINYEYKARQRD